MSLMDELNRISDGISQKIESSTNEARTRSYLVDPFIGALGYNVFDPTEVVPEYTADFGTKRGEKVDYAIMREGKPIILIEAKKARASLSIGEASQIFRYYATTEARFGILTNGVKYQFYTDLEKRNIMDRQPFLIIDMLNLDERLVKELEGFTKANFDAERILSSAKELKLTPEIRRKLAEEYQQPSRDLVRLLANGLYSGSFKQSVFEEFAPIVRKAFHEFVDDKIASRPSTVAEPAPVETEVESIVREAPAISDTGQFVEIPIYLRYKRKRYHDATLLLDASNPKKSRIRFEGEVLSVSASALKVVQQYINPKVTSASGWWLWKLTDPDGNERHIGELRDDEGLRRRLLGMD